MITRVASSASNAAPGRGNAMPRKLKTYQTSLGFFDLAIAAPSMKAALQAWGADRNLFHDGVAKVSDDPDVIAGTMAVPGVVLKRPVGSRFCNGDVPDAWVIDEEPVRQIALF